MYLVKCDRCGYTETIHLGAMIDSTAVRTSTLERSGAQKRKLKRHLCWSCYDEIDSLMWSKSPAQKAMANLAGENAALKLRIRDLEHDLVERASGEPV